MILKARVEAEEDAIRWPWERNELELALRLLQQQGAETLVRLAEEQESRGRIARELLVRVEERARLIALQVNAIDSRLILGRKPVEAELLIKQARAFFEQGQYVQSSAAAQEAADNLATQIALLSRELGRYTNRDRITRWQEMARHTIEWSRAHRDTAIVISKADRLLTLYRNGEKVRSYPVRLGFNGIREKRYQGDGATPEGRYRITRKRGQGETQYYRALVLDYPNAEDRRRFLLSRRTGHIPRSRAIGGQIEIHGVENEAMARTLGCIMLNNEQMASLFNHVDRGTPVTIVGALDERNSVALALASLASEQREI
jgi:lipoprotein-anchoring transpeptidase ErfK/SrfK